VTVSAPVSVSLVTLFRHRLYVEGEQERGQAEGAHRQNGRVANELAGSFLLRERRWSSDVVTDPGSGPRDERLFLTPLAPFTKKIGTD
jgi:hypothetical protein